MRGFTPFYRSSLEEKSKNGEILAGVVRYIFIRRILYYLFNKRGLF
jgi:hypothetical protein